MFSKQKTLTLSSNKTVSFCLIVALSPSYSQEYPSPTCKVAQIFVFCYNNKNNGAISNILANLFLPKMKTEKQDYLKQVTLETQNSPKMAQENQETKNKRHLNYGDLANDKFNREVERT